MIVVDTNTIAYLYLPTAYTPNVEKVLGIDSAWAAPRLWRSEMRNILALYMRKEIVDFEIACQIQRQAEALMADGEYEMDSLSVLALAERSGCSAYDCEFAALAENLGTRLVTSDKKLQKAFPDVAVSAKAFIAGA